MGDLDNSTKRKLESIFEMGGGYVLDFSNASFADFVKTAIGFDPYEKYDGGSKAVLLRKIWQTEPPQAVAKLNLDLLEHWRVGKLIAGTTPTPFELELHDELKAQFSAPTAGTDPASIAFLAKDFAQLDLTSLPADLTAAQVVAARLEEIDRCLQANAPLAVIFLVGSTLEGLLMELALAQATTFTAATAAPRAKGVVKQVQAWTLSDLIAVAREMRVLSEDVARHADHVRNFRNYIHPRQQLKESFEPRIETARIAQQVLRAALTDLEKLGGTG